MSRLLRLKSLGLILAIQVLFVPLAMAQPVFTKTANQTMIQSGECATYTLTFECSLLEGFCMGVTLTDVIPAGFTFDQSTPLPDMISGTGTGLAGETITWDFGDVPAGTSIEISVALCADPGVYGASTTITNTAIATYDGSFMLSSSDDVTVTSSPQWTINKAKTSGPIYHNDPVNYSLTISGPGIGGTQNLDNVIVSDVLPPGAMFISASNGGTQSMGVITWNLGTLDVTAIPPALVLTYTVKFPATDPSNNTGSGPINKTNTVTLTGDDQDGNPYTRIDDLTVQLLPPHFEVTGSKSAGDLGILVLDSVNMFNIGYGNASTVPLANLMVNDTIPSQFNVVGLSVGGCSLPTDSTDIDVVIRICPRGSNVVSRTVTIPDLNDGVVNNINVFAAPVSLDSTTEWICNIKLTHGPGAVPRNYVGCDMVITVTDAHYTDVTSSTGHSDNAGNETDICVSYNNKVYVTGDQRPIDLPIGQMPITLSVNRTDNMVYTSRDARLDPKKTIAVATPMLPPGAPTQGNPYFQGSILKYCVTFDNNASAFQPLYDPLGVDILPAGIDFLPDSGMMAGYIIQTDNSNNGRYLSNPSLINFTVENNTPTAGQTRLTWRLSDSLDVGESVVLCFYGRIQDNFPADQTLTNRFCLNGNNAGLFCDENDLGKPNNFSNPGTWNPNNFLPLADSLEQPDMCCKEVIITVDDSTAVPELRKVVLTAGPYEPYDTICYRLTVGNDVHANSTLPDPILLDALSDKVTFLDGYTIVNNNTGLILDNTGTNPSFIIDTDQMGRKILRWNFTGEFPIQSRVQIDYCVRVNVGASGGVNNTSYVAVPGRELDCQGPSYIDATDFMGNGPSIVDTLCTGQTASFTLSSAAKFSAIKWVKGACDSVFTKVPDIGRTAPDDSLEFLLELVNVGNIPFQNLRIVDILPFVGDMGVRLNTQPRNTHWEPILTDQVIQLKGNPVQAVKYSLSEDPCRMADGIVITDNGTCDPPAWNSDPNALGGIQNVNSFRIDFGPQIINPLDTFQFLVKMIAPVSGVGIAYNSFAWAGERTDNGNTLAAEPNKVCIIIKQDTIGNFVWIDEDMDGHQDAGEQPIEGVPMALFNPRGQLMAYTYTDVNGHYLFSSVQDSATQTWIQGGIQRVVSPDSNYYVVCGYDPITMQGINIGAGLIVNNTNYALTLHNIGSDTLDNDGSVAGQDGAMTPAFLDGLIYEAHYSGPPTQDTTIDFGFFIPLFAIGNQVWYDDDNNGLIDPGEGFVDSALVILHYYDPGSMTCFVLDSQYTDINGLYLFDSLFMGQYLVEVAASNFGPGGALQGYNSSSAGVTLHNGPYEAAPDPDTNIDGDDNGTFNGNLMFPGSVFSDTITLSDVEPLNELPDNDLSGSPDENSNLTIDLGFVIEVTVGGNVWFDVNNDGLQPGGETIVAGVPVNLYLDTNVDGIPDGPAIATQLTDSNGDYYFDGLVEGKYIIGINPPSNLSGSSTPTGGEGDDQVDNNDNGAQNAPGDEIFSNTIMLMANNEPNDANEPGSGGGFDLLDDNNGDMTIDFGLVPAMSLGSTVFFDGNNNATQDPAEPGIAGITVVLFNDVAGDGYTPGIDLIEATTTTDANGNYYFGNLSPGTYVVGIIPPGNLPLSSNELVDENNPDSDLDGFDNGMQVSSGDPIYSGTVTLLPLTEPDNTLETAQGGNQDNTDETNGNMTVDFGLYPGVSIGSTVFSDLDNDAFHEPGLGESGIPGVLVILYDENLNPLDSTITNSDGDYYFGGLPEGKYIVGIPAQAFLADEGLEHFPVSSTDIASTSLDDNLDENDNGAQASGPGTAVYSPVIMLSVNSEPINAAESGSGGTQDDAFDSNGNMTVDFGFTPLFSIGNQVWFDNNNNGIIDPAEPFADSVLVILHRYDGVNYTAVETLYTDANGLYLFDTLFTGEYLVEIAASNFGPGGALQGYTSSSDGVTLNSGPYETAPDPDGDNDDDDSGTRNGNANFPGSVVSGLITLSVNEPLNEDPDNDTSTAADEHSNLTVDFGFVIEVTVGGNVWFDIDNDGQQPGTESTVAGVPVHLYLDTNVDGIPDGRAIATQLTDANGDYYFDGLVEGKYIIGIDPPATLSGSSTPTGGQADNQVDNNDNGAQDAPGDEIFSNTIMLMANTEPNDTNEPGSGGGFDALDDNNGDMTIDFGLVPAMSLGSTVFVDDNNNTVQDPTEPGIAGISVILYNDLAADGYTPGIDLVLATTTTDANGDYYFGNLYPGNYVVGIIPPASLPLSSNEAADENDPNSDLDGFDNGMQVSSGDPIFSGSVELLPLTEPDNMVETEQGGNQDNADETNGNMTVDFGLYPGVSIGSTVFSDLDNDAFHEPGLGENGIPGVIVILYDENLNPLDTTITNSDGDYFFGGLPEGNYIVGIPAQAFLGDEGLEFFPNSSTDIASTSLDDNLDENDNGAQAGGPATAVYSPVITLSVNSEPTGAAESGSGGIQDDAEDSNGNMTIDFGFVPGSTPLVGIAKYAVNVTNLPDGSANVTYELNIQNYGDMFIQNLQVTDDLAATFPPTCVPTILSLTSSDFVENVNYNGVSDINLLAGTDNLPIGGSGSISITIHIDECGTNFGPFSNTAILSGASPFDIIISDDSQDGSNPDPDADGDPTNNDEPTIVQFDQNPSIGAAKRVADATLNPDGSFIVLYEINIENFGDVNLDSVQVTDDLTNTFPAPCSILDIVLTGSNDIQINPAYDGVTDLNLLIGNNILQPGESSSVLLEVTVDECAGTGPFFNQAVANGVGPDGTAVQDSTVNGSDPDPNGDNNPNEDSPTPFSLTEEPNLGLAKYLSQDPINNGDGTYTVNFCINVENIGNVNIDSLSVTDDLDAVFGATCNYDVTGIQSDEFEVNTGYNGNTDTELLVAGEELKSWDEGQICITVNVGPCDDLGPCTNSATGKGETPTGVPVTDVSQSGSNPDPDGDGDPTNNNEPTEFEFAENPVIGIAKRVLNVANLPDGSSTVTYEFNIRNYGNVSVSGLQATDDLELTFPATCQVSVLSISSDDFTENINYNGVSNINLLTGIDNLPVAGTGSIVIVVNVDNCGVNEGPFNNTAQVTAVSPTGLAITDDSQDGSNPDPDADGNPTNNTVPTPVSFDHTPLIGAAKRVAQATLNPDGSFVVLYEINVENFGDVTLDSIQVTDDLSTVFPAPCSVLDIVLTGSNDIEINPNYNGASDANLLIGNNTLEPGEISSILLEITVDSCAGTGPFLNDAVVTAQSPDGTTVQDSTVNGSDPDPNNDGNPDEESPTPFTLTEDPYLGVAKYVKSGPTNNGDGTYTLTFGIRLENNGNVNLDSLSVTDNLNTVFSGACGFEVTGITSEEFQVNLAYDGVANTQLVLPGEELKAWDEGEICITVVAGPCVDLGPFTNSATASGETPTDVVITDVSQSGTNPDPDGDGDPTNNNVPTPFEFTENPVVGIAKRAVNVTNLPDGSANVTYEFNIQNYGNVQISDLQVTDNLATTFPATCVPTILSLTSDDFTENASYDGVTDLNLLTGIDLLPVDGSGSILLTINVAECGTNDGPFTNTATVTGASPSDVTISDVSQDGSDPDPDADDDPTNNNVGTVVSFDSEGSVGIAKRLVSIQYLADGSADMIFEFNVENFGTVVLDSLQVVDTLITTFGAPCSVSILTLTSDDFIVNSSFNGITDFNLLNGWENLEVGEKGAILLQVNVASCEENPIYPGPFDNSAFASGVAPSGVTIVDESQNGADPDPNGDGNPDEAAPTPINFEQVLNIGLAKNVVSAVANNDGTFSITYEFNIENFSTVVIDSIQVVDDLGAAFPGPCSVSVTELTSDDFLVNPAYDGISNINLLLGSDDLVVDDKGAILLSILVSNCGILGPFENNATLTGEGPGGVPLVDESVDGTDPDPNGDGVPDEQSPTIVDFNENPIIGVSKRVSSGPALDADDNYVLTYEIRVQNYGDVDLDSVQVVDSLAITFAPAESWTLVSIESEEFNVNNMFNGGTDPNLLLGNDPLLVGEEGAIYVTVRVAPGGFDGPYFNIATGLAESPFGTDVTDNSNNGSDPDPDADGDPTNNDVVTPVVLACFVGIICPNVPDTLYSPNDIGWCRAVFNIPPAEIITCAGAPDSLIQYMLTGQGAEGVLNDIWIDGQPTGLEYIVGTTKVSMRASIPSLPGVGFSDTCMFWIVVLDKEYPVAVCKDIFVAVDDNCEFTITPDDVDGGSTDNCAIDTLLISRDEGLTFVDEITFTIADLINPFVQVVLQVTDTSGNISYCVATVTVIDVDAPEVICQDDITVETEPNVCYGKIPVIIPPIMSNDNCPPVITLDQYPDAGVLFGSRHLDSIEVFLIATDIDGNMDTCSLFVHLDDTEIPEWLNCPRPPIQTKAMPGMCGAFVNFSLPIATDNCELDTIIQIDQTGLTSGDMFPVGTTILKWLAYDIAGNVSDTCRIKILVNDAQIPVITCLEDISVVNDAGECGAVVNNLAIEATDNCPDNLAITYEITDEDGKLVSCGITDASGENFPVGVNTVTYKVYDQPIVLISEVVQSLVDAIEITNFGPSSMDLSCVTIQRVGAGPETYVIPDGIIIPPGGTYVHNFITNIGAGTPAGYYLVLEDTQYDHVSTNGYNIGIGFTGVLNGGDVWRQYICDHDNASDWVVADACHPSTIGVLNPGLIFFPSNGHISSLQNQLPNEVTCQFTVTVTDIELPYCAENLENLYQAADLPVAIDLLNDGCASSVINVTDVFEVGHVNVIDLQITYPNVGALTVTITSPSGTEVTLFEGLCPGLQDVDISLSDTADVSVNFAPCGPLGQGGFYIPQEALSVFCEEPAQGAWTLEVSSSSGAVGSITNWGLQIFDQVPYSQQDTTLENVLGSCGAPFTWTHPIVGDNCCDGEITVDYETEDGIDVPQAGPIEGGETVTEFFEVGVTTVIYTLTDGNGNVSQCQFNVTVLDTESPVVSCPQNIIINLDPGACDAPVSFVPSFISDNCSIDSIYSNSGDFFDIGMHEGTIIVYDPAGNADTCTFTINVIEYIPVNNNLACNNQIQLSLPEDCTVQVGADMILEGDDYRCYENYCITLEDEDGNVIPNGILTLEHVGTCVYVKVTDCLGGGNSCWGKICVELKLKPEISCPADITVGCNQNTDVDITGEPEVLSCEQTITKTYTDVITDNGECGEPRIYIQRTWKVTDESGNFSTCVQNITVESFRFDQVEFPADIIAYSCVDVVNNPDLITPAFSGEPTINGQSIYGDHYCEIFVGYWDEKLYDANCRGSYSILRHWLIQDECLPLVEGMNPLRHIQNILVKDNVDPVIACPQDMIVSAVSNCEADVSLPVPHYGDLCSDIATFSIQTSAGSLLHFGGNNYVLANLPIGTHTVRYKVADNCKNTVTCEFHITVIDDVIPVAICDEHTIVTLTNDGPNGVTLVPASVFDDGSWDNCGPVTFRVRRMDSCIDFDWTTEGACVDDNPGGIPPVNSRDRGTVHRECAVFSCCDVGNGPVMVELEVTDIHGNVNTCMVEVEVQDKLSPFVECPPDIIISCDYWFNVQEGTFVDADGNHNGNLDEDPLSPIFGNLYDAFAYNDDESVRGNVIINDPGNEQYNQPHFWGIEGWADDNCEVNLQVRVRVIDDCSGNELPSNAPPGAVRLIERRFSALDGNEGVAPGTCTQRIWVVNYDPFYITDNTCNNSNAQDGVIWPCDVLITTCPDDPTGTGEPTILNDGCSLIGVTFDDQRFDFVDGACFKILRTWKVIDWCQYNPQTGAGQWAYTQVIKVHDQDGPQFVAPCETQVLCVADPGVTLPDNNQAFLGEDNPLSSSCSVHLNLSRTVHETCSDIVNYDVKIYPFNGTDYILVKSTSTAVVDENNDAVLSFDTRQSNIPSIRLNGLPYNSQFCGDYHRILWSVEDGCGNWTTCEYLIRLEDCKQPSPVCINGLSTVVMPIGGQVTVWAKDFNASSFDDCTPAENLLYSFSGDTYQPSHTYTCDNVPAFGAQLSVDVWVADAGVDHNCNGQIEWSERNKDHCTTTIVITDNIGICPGSGSILAGEILTPHTQAVELVNVFLSNPDYVFPSFVTIHDGKFKFASVPLNESYTITPARNDNHKNGVSTLDLVKIQKHLLGLETFSSPYQYIAADANNNQQVNAIDLIEIRKLILGIYTAFPQNQSWRFVETSSGLTLANPWEHTEVINIADLATDSMMHNDFVAVKVGDVNNTAKANAAQVLPRDGQRVMYVYATEVGDQEADEIVKLNFAIPEDLEGFQWTFETEGLEYIGMESTTMNLDDSNIGLLQEGVITMSWNDASGSQVSSAEHQGQSFNLVFHRKQGGNLREMIRMTSHVTAAEGYTRSGEIIEPQLHFGTAESPLEFALYQNEPNPWNGTTLVRFDLPEEGLVKFTVFDASGKVVVLKEAFYKPGPHSVVINNKEINTNGVFYYRVDCGQYSATKKMVRIH
ncbi:MAG: HYR domain-containing protein [Saprospiraceae bacterium]|nr:HYR domain-containing protein [Candidatus Opimibacter iunctus]